MDFKEIVQKRYACSKFSGKSIPEKKLKDLLEMIRLSASSYGLQPYKIKIISDDETKEKLLKASFNQEQITTAQHLLIFCANIDVDSHINIYERLMRESAVPDQNIQSYVGVMRGAISRMNEEQILIWSQKQLYLAVANAINGAKELGFDSCPMEGFLPEEYSKELKLPNTLIPTVVVPIGFAADEARPKIRFTNKELFF